MKRLVFVVTVLFLASSARAQTWDEWFRQKKTQIRYLVEQITALKMYGSAVKKSYDIVDSGLNSIGSQKESDFWLHQYHFASFLNVKQGVKGSTVIQRIYSFQVAVQRIYTECTRKFRKDEEFTSAEKEYFKTVLTNILGQCRAAGDEAILLTSNGCYQMSDNERLKRLQEIYSDMEELYVFARHFRNEMATAAISRIKEKKEVKTMKSLY